MVQYVNTSPCSESIAIEKGKASYGADIPNPLGCVAIDEVSSKLNPSMIALTTLESKMKVKAVIKRLEEDGWYLARTKGSHRQFKHMEKPGAVTVSGKLSTDVPVGTLKNIWRQAQIDLIEPGEERN